MPKFQIDGVEVTEQVVQEELYQIADLRRKVEKLEVFRKATADGDATIYFLREDPNAYVGTTTKTYITVPTSVIHEAVLKYIEKLKSEI